MISTTSHRTGGARTASRTAFPGILGGRRQATPPLATRAPAPAPIAADASLGDRTRERALLCAAEQYRRAAQAAGMIPQLAALDWRRERVAGTPPRSGLPVVAQARRAIRDADAALGPMFASVLRAVILDGRDAADWAHGLGLDGSEAARVGPAILRAGIELLARRWRYL